LKFGIPSFLPKAKRKSAQSRLHERSLTA
jgi:hypothetical protein